MVDPTSATGSLPSISKKLQRLIAVSRVAYAGLRIGRRICRQAQDSAPRPVAHVEFHDISLARWRPCEHLLRKVLGESGVGSLPLLSLKEGMISGYSAVAQLQFFLLPGYLGPVIVAWCEVMLRVYLEAQEVRWQNVTFYPKVEREEPRVAATVRSAPEGDKRDGAPDLASVTYLAQSHAALIESLREIKPQPLYSGLLIYLRDYQSALEVLAADERRGEPCDDVGEIALSEVRHYLPRLQGLVEAVRAGYAESSEGKAARPSHEA